MTEAHAAPAPMPAKIRLILADDHPLVRDGLRARLEAAPRLEVIGEAASGAEALALAEALRPDLMLIDVGMRDMNGIRLTTLLHERLPEVVVLMLSMYDNSEYVVNAVRAGARGYVLKEASAYEIIAAIEAVAAGGTYYSAAVAQALVQCQTPAPTLTAREHEVLLKLAHGHSNKTIARELNISVRTVETHRLSLRRKLGIDTASGLLKYALERGWTTL
jgi:DNA-binding NarL/FixJ family response regulator